MYDMYQVMPGDTLEDLARSLGVCSEELRRLNNLPFNYTLVEGEYLKIPNKNLNVFYEDYIIKEGDTLYSIAKNNNVNLKELIELNGLDENEYAYPGERIKIPKIKTNNEDRVYVVEEGDTLFEASNKMNTDLYTLLKNNENVCLSPGQILTIKETTAVYK